jgi:predicted RNA-binding Zn-ribbon protein involved in translation (DUF1610 family)
MALTMEQQRLALQSVAAWRIDAAVILACPSCGRPGLAIVDRSARPHAEWYALSCAACGSAETLHIPMGDAVPTLD